MTQCVEINLRSAAYLYFDSLKVLNYFLNFVLQEMKSSQLIASPFKE